jgi:hypothetical protein
MEQWITEAEVTFCNKTDKFVNALTHSPNISTFSLISLLLKAYNCPDIFYHFVTDKA